MNETGGSGESAVKEVLTFFEQVKNKPAALIQILGEPARRSQSGVLSLASSIGEPTIRASLLTNSLLF